MGAGLYIAAGVSVACIAILFVMGNAYVRAALTAFVLLLVGGYALFVAYATGFLAYLFERYG